MSATRKIVCILSALAALCILLPDRRSRHVQSATPQPSTISIAKKATPLNKETPSRARLKDVQANNEASTEKKPASRAILIYEKYLDLSAAQKTQVHSALVKAFTQIEELQGEKPVSAPQKILTIRKHIAPLLNEDQLLQLEALEEAALTPEEKGLLTEMRHAPRPKGTPTVEHYAEKLKLSDEQREEAERAIKAIDEQSKKFLDQYQKEHLQYAKMNTVVGSLAPAVYRNTINQELTKRYFRKFLTDEQYDALIVEIETLPKKAAMDLLAEKSSDVDDE